MARILIVDDSRINREIIRESLADDDYQFDEAIDGEEAVRMATANPPDLILMDITMPKLDGVQALRAIKSHTRTATVPIVMVTSLGQDRQLAKCLDEGASDYIVPPFTETAFRARVRAALRAGSHLPEAPTSGKGTARKANRGQILGVLGAKGGVGATSVAINFVVQLLGRDETSVGLIEIHNATAGLEKQLGVNATASLSSLMGVKPAAISADAVASACIRHPAGCKVLFAPHSNDLGKEVRPSLVKAVLAAARRLYEYTVLDISSVPTPGAKKALSSCDQLVVVTEADGTSIAAAKKWLARLAAWNIPRSSLSIAIVNKTNDRAAMSPEELRRELGFPVVGHIKPDPDGSLLASRLISLCARHQ